MVQLSTEVKLRFIHAMCFIAEIQQTSNVTYRIYDFNRKDKNGNEYYMVYHRHDNPHSNRGFHRQLCVDRMEFAEDGRNTGN